MIDDDNSTSTSCDPDKSLIPYDAEFNAVELFDAWAEMEFIDDICESEDEAAKSALDSSLHSLHRRRKKEKHLMETASSFFSHTEFLWHTEFL
jgi:hypothetical protein